MPACVALCVACLAGTVGALHAQAGAFSPSARPPDTQAVRSSPPPGGGGRIGVVVYARAQPGLELFGDGRSSISAGFDRAAPGGAPGAELAGDVERTRQMQIARLREAAIRRSRPSLARLQALIRRHDGRVLGSQPAPGAVFAQIPAIAYRTLTASPLVQAVAVDEPRVYHGVAEASGAAAWHAAGCTGAGAGDGSCPGTSAPAASTGPTDSAGGGTGGPDFGVDDQGINNHHDAFTGGPTPALGRSPSVVGPAGAPATNGSLHANTIAAIVAVKDPAHLGAAYGIDKVLDPVAPCVWEAGWLLGLVSPATSPSCSNPIPGTVDLPESINKSYGIPSQGGMDDGNYAAETDTEVNQYGIAVSASAGNGGPYAPLSGTLRGTIEQYRAEHPCVAFNAICVGSVSGNALTSPSDDTVEGYSSRGPSVGGRKKPDLVARNGGAWGCPDGGAETVNDSLWKSGSICGEGTSYSAPFASAGALLLAGVGVSSPMAQKAILINSAYPIDSESDADSAPEEYWAPDVGWGEIALDQAFDDRGNYRLGTVGPAPSSNARFFRVDGQSVGDRTTLAWNRRAIVTNPAQMTTLAYTTTDLDLQQLTLAGADDDLDVCGASTTCGVDLSEDTDTGPTVVTGGVVTRWPAADSSNDTVEQVRAKSAGASIVKVRATSTIDGAAEEPFAIASSSPLVPLSTPAINANAPLPAPAFATPVGQQVTVSASFTNESAGTDLVSGLDLHNGEVTINLPPGVTLVSGIATQSVGTIATGATKNASWTVTTNASDAHSITYTATGERFGETFATTSAPATLTADSDPPVVGLAAPSGWQPQRTSNVSWNATDQLTGVASVSIESSRAGGPWQPVYSGSDASGSAAVTAGEGESVSVRVVATDGIGNDSAPSLATWQADGDPPELDVTAPTRVRYGSDGVVRAAASNVGSPVVATYRTDRMEAFAPLAGDALTFPAMTSPVYVEFRAQDALGRVIQRAVSIDVVPRPTSIRAHTRRRSGTTLLKLAVRPSGGGAFQTNARCRSGQVSRRTQAPAGHATVRLRRGLGRCAVRVRFLPYQRQVLAASSKRLVVRVR